MANAYTGTAAITNVVQTAYDKLVEFQLRSHPLFRMLVDKKPAQQAMPGSSVVFERYANLATAITPLTEAVDPDAVAIGNTTTTTVTLNEYGNAVLVTQRLEALAFTDVDPAIANIMAYNCIDTLDVVIQNVIATGTQYIGTSGTGSATIGLSPTVSTITATNLLSSAAIRYVTAQLRGANVQPKKGESYLGIIHPYVSVDLRAESGAGAWRDPHVYSAPDAIWNGEIGLYEGAVFIENPRVINATVGASSARIFNTYFFGQQAIAEAVGYDPTVVVGPVTDKLERFRPLGWKALLGWGIYRNEAVWRVMTGNTVQPS